MHEDVVLYFDEEEKPLKGFEWRGSTTQFMCLKDDFSFYAENKLPGGRNRNREAIVCSLLRLTKAWTIVVTAEVRRNGLYQSQ